MQLLTATWSILCDNNAMIQHGIFSFAQMSMRARGQRPAQTSSHNGDMYVWCVWRHSMPWFRNYKAIMSVPKSGVGRNSSIPRMFVWHCPGMAHCSCLHLHRVPPKRCSYKEQRAQLSLCRGWHNSWSNLRCWKVCANIFLKLAHWTVCCVLYYSYLYSKLRLKSRTRVFKLFSSSTKHMQWVWFDEHVLQWAA